MLFYMLIFFIVSQRHFYFSQVHKSVTDLGIEPRSRFQIDGLFTR